MLMNTVWIQFLLVVVPVLSLMGSWLALRAVADRRSRLHGDDEAMFK
jgi:hypothetical protein